MIPFNVPPYIGKEDKYIKQAIDSRKICGDGQFTKKCNVKFEEMTGAKKVLMTTSGTSALEMAALLTDIKPGDEAVMPSYTFVSTANAFVLRGATIVFVDIRPDTMNIDENLIEDAITEKQRLLFLFITVALPVRWTPYAISPKDTTLLLLKMPHRVLWAFIKEEHSVRSEILAVTVFMKQRTMSWVKAAELLSMKINTWSVLKSLEKKVQTADRLCRAWLICIHGMMSGHPSCQVIF